MKRVLLTIVLVVLASSGAWSQVAEASQPVRNEVSSGSPTTPWLPVGLNGETGSLAFSSETGRTNLLSGGVTVSTTYDDNALSNNIDRIGNFGYLIAPTIAIEETRPRTIWTFNYSPGFAFNQRSQQRQDYSHNLDFNFQYRMSERFTLRARDTWVDENTAYAQFNNSNPLSAPGSPMHQANDSIITPLAHRMSNLTDLDLIYQLGESTIVGASGSFNTLHFSNQVAGSGTPLLDSKFGSAQAYYSHRVTGSNWLGITYNFQRILTAGQIREATNTESYQLFYTFAPKPSLSLSLFVGPARTRTNDQFTIVLFPFVIPRSITHQSWTVDGGAAFGWQGRRTSAQARLIRHVTDGGGVTGAVRVYMGSVSLRRQLNQNLIGNIGFNYGSNNSLSYLYGNSIRSISGTVGLERSLGEHFSVGLSYARDHQNSDSIGGSSSPATIADHNRGWVSISYHFARPIGR